MPQRLAKFGDRLVEVAELFEDAPESGVRGSQLRLEPDRRAVAGLSLVQPTKLMQDDAQVVVRRGKVGAKTGSLLEMSQSLVGLAQIHQCRAQVACASPNSDRALPLAGDVPVRRPFLP